MSNPQSGKKNAKSQPSPFRKLAAKPKINMRLGGLFAVIFAIVGVWVVLQAQAAPSKRLQGVNLTLVPASQKLLLGDTLNVALELNTAGETVNAVQANLTYPADKFEFVDIDGTGSAFEIAAQTMGGNGSVNIGRATATPVNSSNALVATVHLKAVAAARKAKISFTTGSAVVRVSDTTNVLAQTAGGQYTIQ